MISQEMNPLVSEQHLADYVFTPAVFFTYILPPIMLEGQIKHLTTNAQIETNIYEK